MVSSRCRLQQLEQELQTLWSHPSYVRRARFPPQPIPYHSTLLLQSSLSYTEKLTSSCLGTPIRQDQLEGSLSKRVPSCQLSTTLAGLLVSTWNNKDTTASQIRVVCSENLTKNSREESGSQMYVYGLGASRLSRMNRIPEPR